MALRNGVRVVQRVLLRDVLEQRQRNEILRICGKVVFEGILAVDGSDGVQHIGANHAEHAVKVSVPAGEQSAQIDDDVQTHEIGEGEAFLVGVGDDGG